MQVLGKLSAGVFVPLAVALVVSLTLSAAPGRAAVQADQPPVSPATVLSAIGAPLDYPLPPAGRELKERPARSQIYQVDTEPLGQGTPLLMIHGGNGETVPLFHWAKAIAHFNQAAEFQKRYKVFLLRYDSRALLESTVPQSKEAVLELYKACGKRPITVLALSMGGNVAQLVMGDPEASAAVDTVLAMGTPFHGSPLFSADWFQFSLYKSHFFGPVKVLDSLDYRAYFDMHKNYQKDLKWDDSDQLIPEVGLFRSRLPFGPKGYLTPERDTGTMLARVNAADGLDKTKFITYAGYLVNPFVLDKQMARWKYALLAPYWQVSMQLRAQLGREQAALMVLNREISKVDAGPAGSGLGSGVHVYALNDGITPVGSALYLSPEALRTHMLLHESDIRNLNPVIDVRRARVFRNINHVTFVDGRPPHRGSQLVRDELKPEQEPQYIFDWILADLLHPEGGTSTISSSQASAREGGPDTLPGSQASPQPSGSSD